MIRVLGDIKAKEGKMDSILTEIKKLLSIIAEDTTFDKDVIIHINSVLFVLNQLGIGTDGFVIKDDSAVWTDFIPEDGPSLELVKSYIYLKVKLLFDPPLSSAVIESINKQISEFEWRLQVAADLV
jgi:hypothetical protein